MSRKVVAAVVLVVCLMTCWIGFAADPPGDPTPAGAPMLGVYRWGAANSNGGAGGNEAFARWLGRPVVWAEDFTPTQQWNDHIEGGGWQLKEWSAWKKGGKGRRLIFSVPLLPGPWDRSGPKSGKAAGKAVSLEAGARGAYNEHYRILAENLVRQGLDDTILRLGWEFNGGWYTWRASDNPEAFAEYWRQVVTTMRGVPGAEKLEFCWNPAQGWQQFPADRAWPGAKYVDYVGLDLYDDSWATDTYPLPADATPEQIEARRTKVWNEVLCGGSYGLKFWKEFAAKQGRPLAIPEWGVNRRSDGHGGLDNEKFIERMHAFITDPDNNVAFHCYFDVQAPDGHHQLSPGIKGDEKTEFPRAAAKFRELFSLPAANEKK